jgi:hypothetical protein
MPSSIPEECRQLCDFPDEQEQHSRQARLRAAFPLLTFNTLDGDLLRRWAAARTPPLAAPSGWAPASQHLAPWAACRAAAGWSRHMLADAAKPVHGSDTPGVTHAASATASRPGLRGR